MNTNGTPRFTLRTKQSVVKRVPLSDIYVDMQFQRAVNPNQLNTIKNDFHPHGVGIVLLAHVDGENRDARYAIIDGQTRIQALNELHKEVAENARPEIEGLPADVQAEVFESLTVGEAALLFGLRNNQKPIPTYHRDRILANEGDPVMTDVVSQSAAAGYVVFAEDEGEVTMPHRAHARRIVGYGVRAARPKLLQEVLVIQANAFGTEVGYLDKDVMQATAELLLRNPSLQTEALEQVLATLGLPGIRGQAEVAANRYGQRMSKSCRGVIADAYNKGRRTDKIHV